MSETIKITKKLSKKSLNSIFNIFLLIYLIFGFYLSINTGISTDEFIEQTNWNLSKDAIKNFFGLNDSGYSNLYSYEWKFHGIGHHYFSQVYLSFINLFINLDQYSKDVSNILLNHSFIFLIYFFSGVFSKKIVELVIKDKLFGNIFLFFYLLYPYLLGHGFYNPKDIPFLFTWVLSSYISIKIFLNLYERKTISISNILLLSLTTAILFSIRISGILILLQYLITFIITCNAIKESYYQIIKSYFYKIVLFVFITLLVTLLLYPVFWNNPLLVFDSINQMRSIPYGVCTLTLGKCMDALNLPSSYIFIWLFFKLPILALLGMALFPFIEKKIFTESKNQIILGSILLSTISIIFLLIFFEVNLYDELRHIMFLIPLILISAFSIFYLFSKKLTLVAAVISITIFLIQNFNMYPYQYTWFNLFGNFVNINNNFELDYWGVSGRNIAKKINTNNEIKNISNKCIYVSPKHIVEPFINSNYNCVKPYFSIYPKSSEKYVLVKYTRNIRRENPSGCKLVFVEEYNLNFVKKNLRMGEVYICN